MLIIDLKKCNINGIAIDFFVCTCINFGFSNAMESKEEIYLYRI